MDNDNLVLEENWTSLITPNVLCKNMENNIAEIVVEPLERGSARTIAVALRRNMLAMLSGGAIFQIQIPQVFSEYDTVNGIEEDVAHIIINFKRVVLRVTQSVEDSVQGTLSITKPGPVTADMLSFPHSFEVVNKEHVICNVSEGVSLEIKVFADVGKGYIPTSRRGNKSTSGGSGKFVYNNEGNILFNNDGMILMDALYSPVLSVSFEVEDSRVGQVTDYEKLIFRIETNGAVSPEKALSLASRILQEQMSYFIKFKESDVLNSVSSESEDDEYDEVLFAKVDVLELSVRSYNCLKSANIIYVGDLVCRKEDDMLRMPNFGRKSLNEIILALKLKGLSFGMNLPNWPPKKFNDLVKKYQSSMEGN
ncbi:MAG: DNA-directed RNA polymerase, alpha subunit [Candidatus Xenolissoclinum pacificiensis L6]|uniref:DNA-directed RNA polymerase subunit alpha n=1 Tax=Candidatus Xenolissoclinum pacificiensis L6 TaxID=1401685 RepID=W2V0X8_9RICK|nr:MAG: DNA-directed RNA polymerase, alpha subunit [Candidatus Xenolissoclinum pacificiensis L6]